LKASNTVAALDTEGLIRGNVACWAPSPSTRARPESASLIDDSLLLHDPALRAERAVLCVWCAMLHDLPLPAPRIEARHLSSQQIPVDDFTAFLPHRLTIRACRKR